ncbi:multidrug effflux MFS transporter [Porticoccus sp. GXU_MW_L64]
MLSVNQLRQNRGFLIFLAGLVALGPFSVDTYMPAMGEMSIFFGADRVAVNLTISFYLLGVSVGQFLGGPLSDRFGRRPIALAGLTLFTLSSLLIVFAPTIEAVQLLRVTQAIGGGFAGVLSMAVLRDVYSPDEVSKKMANVMLVMLIAPLIAPIIGTLLTHLGWQFIFVLLTVIGLTIVLVNWKFIPETCPPTTQTSDNPPILANYKTVLLHTTNGRYIALRYALFAALSGGIFMCYLTNVATVFISQFGLSKWQFSGIFATNAILIMAGNRLSHRLLNHHSNQKILSLASSTQVVLIGLGLAANAIYGEQLLFNLLTFSSLMVAFGMIGPVASGYYISLFSEHTGTAASLFSTLHYIVGPVIASLSALLSAQAVWPLLTVMLGCAIVARLVLPMVKQH